MIRSLAILAAAIIALMSSSHASAQGGTWGTLKGRIVFGGANPPVQAAIPIPPENPSRAECLKANKDKLPLTETWVVNAQNKGIKNVVVWLVDAAGPKSKQKIPVHPDLNAIPKDKLEVVVDQPACSFIPHTLALREGQSLLVKNSAPFPHNFKWTGNFLTKNHGNVLIPAGGQLNVGLEPQRFPILVECTIHPWMRGNVFVFAHPYFAVTDENGAFELKNAPAGNFRLMIWHDTGYRGGVNGINGDPVQIKADSATDLGDLAY